MIIEVQHWRAVLRLRQRHHQPGAVMADGRQDMRDLPGIPGRRARWARQRKRAANLKYVAPQSRVKVVGCAYSKRGIAASTWRCALAGSRANVASLPSSMVIRLAAS